MKGPERFFYDKSTYTGTHARGGPDHVAKGVGTKTASAWKRPTLRYTFEDAAEDPCEAKPGPTLLAGRAPDGKSMPFSDARPKSSGAGAAAARPSSCGAVKRPSSRGATDRRMVG